jgi:hypothetical protein
MMGWTICRMVGAGSGRAADWIRDASPTMLYKVRKLPIRATRVRAGDMRGYQMTGWWRCKSPRWRLRPRGVSVTVMDANRDQRSVPGGQMT